MPNHVHLILKPARADDLGRAVGEAHRRYTNFINARGRRIANPDRTSIPKPLRLRRAGRPQFAQAQRSTRVNR
jgi:REP element-mobilizing transposase RayT